VLELVPIPEDRTGLRALLAGSVRDRGIPGEDPMEMLTAVEQAFGRPDPPARLARDGGRTVGMVVWNSATPIGVGVALAYLEPPRNDAATYRELLDRNRELVGPVPFVSGPLVGLTRREERELFTSLGYTPFARLEMRRSLAEPLPPPREPVPGLRSARLDDEPRLIPLQAAAYDRHFDRYLFFNDPDPMRDAELQMHEVFGGVHGEFRPDVSTVVEASGAIRAACLVVHRSYGPLIVDVMVDPPLRGRGLARAALVGSLERLRAAGDPSVALNVTVGNAPAIRLYERVGFRSSIGPSQDWYDPAIVPTAPGAAYDGPAASGGSAARTSGE